MQRKPEPDLQPLDPDVEALLASARAAPRLPQTTRARALARARALVATSPMSPKLPAPSRHPWLRLMLAVCIVLAAGVVGAALGAVLVLHERASSASESASSQ